jgi:hypothetical protein
MTSEEVLCRAKEERNVLRTVKRRKANWVGHILCRKRCFKLLSFKEMEGDTRKKT